MKNSETILPYHFIDRLKALPFVKEVYLFGSRARGDNRPRSDIDLAVRMLPSHGPYDWLKVVDIIDEADTLLEIDCVNLNAADGKFKERILSQGKLL